MVNLTINFHALALNLSLGVDDDSVEKQRYVDPNVISKKKIVDPNVILLLKKNNSN